MSKLIGFDCIVYEVCCNGEYLLHTRRPLVVVNISFE